MSDVEGNAWILLIIGGIIILAGGIIAVVYFPQVVHAGIVGIIVGSVMIVIGFWIHFH